MRTQYIAETDPVQPDRFTRLVQLHPFRVVAWFKRRSDAQEVVRLLTRANTRRKSQEPRSRSLLRHNAIAQEGWNDYTLGWREEDCPYYEEDLRESWLKGWFSCRNTHKVMGKMPEISEKEVELADAAE